MKRIISCMIILALFFTFLPSSANAQQTEQGYSQEQMEQIVQKYENNADMLETLFCSDDAIGYWRMVNGIEQNGALAWALDVSSKLIGEYPDKQDYGRILANLIAMRSGELAEQIEKQARFDDLKTDYEHAWDLVDVIFTFADANEWLETISPIVDAVTGGVEVSIENVEQAKYYELTIQDYSQNHSFLTAISNYAENPDLRDAAKSLIPANKLLLEKRLEYLVGFTGSIAEFEAEFFVDNLSFELLKNTDLYATDENVRFFTDLSSELADSVSAIFAAGTFAFKATMLAGDIGFGTSDVYNRYQEMKTVADISGALVKANAAITVPNKTSREKLDIIQEKCSLYKSLIVAHARGEYLLYQLLMNDAGVISDVRWIIEYFKNPEKSTDDWYKGQVEVLTTYCSILDNMFVLDAGGSTDNTSDADCLLTRINAYNNGTLWYCYDFTYNENHQLTAVTNSTDPADKVIWKYSYDDYGHLILVEHSRYGTVTVMEQYIYDESGRLTSWYMVDESGKTEYACIYDGHGRMIKTIGENTDQTIVIQCEYNSDGLIERETTTYTNNHTGANSSASTTFGYDAEGRKIYETTDMGGYSYRYSYRYDLKPLCICTDAQGAYILYLYDKVNPFLWKMGMAAGDLTIDEAGRLTRIQGDAVCYEFIYDPAFRSDEDAGGLLSYLPIVESCMDKCRYYDLSAEQQKECRGVLVDLDGNGSDELILQYLDDFDNLEFEVWSIRNGSPICINSFQAFSGGLETNGRVSSATSQGQRYLVYQWYNTGMDYFNDLSEVYCLVDGEYKLTNVETLADLGALTTLMGSHYPDYPGGDNEESAGWMFPELIDHLKYT